MNASKLSAADLLNFIPPDERVSGEYAPFSSIIELNCTADKFGALISQLGPKFPAEDLELAHLWDVMAMFGHERTHFYQSLVSPIIFDYCWQKRLLVDATAEYILHQLKEHGEIKYPVKLWIKPELCALKQLFRGLPLGPPPVKYYYELPWSSLHVIEGLAFYYQLSIRPRMLGQQIVPDIFSRLDEARIRDRIYSDLFVDLIKNIGSDGYFLFPLICWAALLCPRYELDHEWGQRYQKGQLAYKAPMGFYVELVDKFDAKRSLVEEVLNRLRANDHLLSQTWPYFISLVQTETKVEFPDLRKSFEERYAGIRKALGAREFHLSFPAALYLENLLNLQGEALQTVVGMDEQANHGPLLKTCTPPLLFRDSVRVGTVQDSFGTTARELLEYQLGIHTWEGIVDAFYGHARGHRCPHIECPIRSNLCARHSPLPERFEECDFVRALRKLTNLSGLELSQFKVRRMPFFVKTLEFDVERQTLQ